MCTEKGLGKIFDFNLFEIGKVLLPQDNNNLGMLLFRFFF